MGLLVGLMTALLILTIPLDLAFAFDSRCESRDAVHLVWGFGLVRIRLRRGGRWGSARPSGQRAGRRTRLGRRARAAIATPGLTATLVRGAHRIIRSIRVRIFDLRADLGTGDPADTGVLLGTLSGVVAAMPANVRGPIDIRPDFERAKADLQLRGRIRLVPGVVIGHILLLVLSPAVIHAAYRMARA